MSSTLERLLEEELRLANKHLPYRKISLREALSRERPEMILRDGSRHMLDRKELNLLRGLLGDDRDLELPIIIYYLGRGVYMVSGRENVAIISKILGKERSSESDRVYLSRPEVIDLRMILRTTTTIVFAPQAVGE